MTGRGFSRGQQLFRRHLDDLDRQTEFSLAGRRWTLLKRSRKCLTSCGMSSRRSRSVGIWIMTTAIR